MRRKYLVKFYIRCIIFAVLVLIYVFRHNSLEILYGNGFFTKFTFLHILWAVWMTDMILQLVPARGVLTLGSQKQFLMHFRPSNLSATKEDIKRFVRSSNFAGFKVGAVWIVFTMMIHTLVIKGVLCDEAMILVTGFFYVADLICVLFWCPFRVFLMKNRCCATCRIFNWDHVMMFSPLLVIKGFFTWSLFTAALVVYAVWEIYFFIHPERFWEHTNDALKCSNCREQLCGKNMHPGI